MPPGREPGRPGEFGDAHHRHDGHRYAVARWLFRPVGPGQRVVGRVPVRVQRVAGDFDVAEPFHAGRAQPAGDDQAGRESVVRRQRFAVHGQRDERIVRPCLGDRQPPCKTPGIQTFRQHVHRRIAHAGQRQHVAQARAGSFGHADRTGLPLGIAGLASEAVLEESAGVAGAFDGADDRDLRPGGQPVVIGCCRPSPSSCRRQLPRSIRGVASWLRT